jgi:hypothetical protein
VADRQKTQTFRQEGKQLRVLAAARHQEDRLQEERRQEDKEYLVGRQAEGKQTFRSTGRKASMKQ